jgi:6-phosphofructokinase
MSKGQKRIGILTAGGDCPGLNAAIRGVGKTALLKYGYSILGFSSGYLGLIRNEYKVLDELALSGILTVGGTILGSSREKPFKQTEYDDYIMSKPDHIVENYKALGLDCLVCIGGNGTQKTAWRLAELGINVVGVPKTIDNDVRGTDLTFGFDSAVAIAAEAIDRLHTTANSHKRIMVVEVMGHSAGWLTLNAGVAAGGDVILIPRNSLRSGHHRRLSQSPCGSGQAVFHRRCRRRHRTAAQVFRETEDRARRWIYCSSDTEDYGSGNPRDHPRLYSAGAAAPRPGIGWWPPNSVPMRRR